MSNNNKDYNKNEEARNNPVIGWFYIALVIGVPAILLLGFQFGIGHTEWGTKFLVRAFLIGIGLITFIAACGCDPFEGDKK